MTVFLDPVAPVPAVDLLPGQFERIAKALSDPRRFALLEAIGANCGCPNQSLCREFPVSKATISHHIKELTQAGLVEPEREGQYVNYRVRQDVIRAYAAELVRRAGAMTGSGAGSRSRE
jgi:ArsR family transcriptional regulator, arsenate/arsenite/antimonite-responsive transcriptional repressor